MVYLKIAAFNCGISGTFPVLSTYQLMVPAQLK